MEDQEAINLETPAEGGNAPDGIRLSSAPIEDVSRTTNEYIGKYLKKHIYYAIAWAVILIALFAYGRSTQSELLQNFFVLLLFLPFAFYVGIRSSMQDRFMRQFAQEKGFSYSKGGGVAGLNGALFKLGHSQSTNNFITGQVEGAPIDLFLYSYQTGSGKSSQTHNYTVLRFQLSVKMPDILLAKKMTFLEKWPNQEAVNLEGDFNEFFTLYVEKEYEIEALQIFTPDTMAELIDHGKDYSLEITGDQLYIYLGKTATKRKELYAMYDFALYFNATIKPRLAQMKPTLAAMEYVEKT